MSEQFHPYYRWTEYTSEERRIELERRRAGMAVWGGIFAALCAAALVYLFG
jgi:hypothetical protein